MAQVQNLLDLFRKNLPDAQASSDAKAAPKKAAGVSGKAAGNAGGLLPIGPDASRGGNPGASHAPASFRTKMEKSAAKLAAKDRALQERALNGRAQKPADGQSRAATPEEARAPKAKSDSSGPRNDNAKHAQETREGRPAQAQARRAAHAARAERVRDEDLKPQEQSPDPITPDAPVMRQADSGQDDRPQGLDGKSKADLKQGLADLGIQVDDKQLEDPAFLADILRLLQAMPAQALPSEDAQAGNASVDGSEGTAESEAVPADASQTATAPTDAASANASTSPKDAASATAATTTPAGAAATTMTASMTAAAAAAAAAASATSPSPATQTSAPAAQPAGAQAKPQAEGPKPLSRQDLARLLEERIGGLERAARPQSERIQVSAQAPTVTPKEWQGVQTRPQAEGPSPDPMPIADLDRLRVMQAAALQTAPAKNDASGPRTELVLDSDSAEPVAETAKAAPVEAGRDASASQDRDPQSDLFGQKGDQTAGAQTLTPKDGAQAAKDGTAGTQFNQVLEQARAAGHRAAPGAEVAPRVPLHESPVLDQIARRMSLTTHKTGDEINIQLTPEHLGKVRVSLEMKDDGMSARIAVENDSVRKQVEENLSSLKDALKDQGIRLQGLEVSVDQRHASLFNPDGSNSESFFRRQGRGEGRDEGSRGIDNAGLESAPETDTGRRWGYNTLEFIG